MINLHAEVDQRQRKWKFSLAEEILDNLPNLKANKGSKRSVGPFPKGVRIHQIFIRKSGEVSSRWTRYWKVLLSGKVERASLICALSTYGSERN